MLDKNIKVDEGGRIYFAYDYDTETIIEWQESKDIQKPFFAFYLNNLSKKNVCA